MCWASRAPLWSPAAGLFLKPVSELRDLSKEEMVGLW